MPRPLVGLGVALLSTAMLSPLPSKDAVAEALYKSPCALPLNPHAARIAKAIHWRVYRAKKVDISGNGNFSPPDNFACDPRTNTWSLPLPPVWSEARAVGFEGLAP